MISKRVWAAAVARLELHFAPLANSDEMIEIDGVQVSRYDALLVEYHDRIKELDEYLFLKSIDHVIETHTWKGFPMVGVLLEAVEFVRSSIPRQRAPRGPECVHCRGQGLVINPKTRRARPCICAEGKSYKRGWTAHDTKNKHFKIQYGEEENGKQSSKGQQVPEGD